MDIVAIIFFTYWIGILARKKSQPVLRWRWFVVLNWIAFEIVGAGIGFLISRNVLLASMLGFASGFGSYLLAKYRLDKLPDGNQDGDWTDRLGREDD